MDEIKKIVVNSLDGQQVYGIEDSEVREELANVVDGAPEELDSFKEAFEKFKEGNEALAGITGNVERNAKAIAAETERARDAEHGIESKALDASSAEYEVTENAVVFKFATIEGAGGEAAIPAATTEKAGVMSAEDVKMLQEHSELVVYRTGNAITVARKYGKNEDLGILLEPRGPNSITSISKIMRYDSISPLPGEGNLKKTLNISSDFIGPYVVKANNREGDYNGYTGGFHSYEDTGTGAPTATMESCVVTVDGREMTTDKQYAKNVRIVVTNLVQAGNTKNSDGTGDSVLRETVTYEFTGTKLNVSVRILALEDITIRTYYGMQTERFNESITFYGSKVTKGEFKGARSEDKDLVAFVSIGDFGCCLAYMNGVGIGNRMYAKGVSSAFTSGSKAYYNLISVNSPLTLLNSEETYWSGYYEFAPSEEMLSNIDGVALTHKIEGAANNVLNEVNERIVKISAFAESNAGANKILTEIGQIYYCTNPASGAYRQLRQATGGEVGNFTYSVFPIRQDAVYVYDNKIYVYNGEELVLAGEELFAKNTEEVDALNVEVDALNVKTSEFVFNDSLSSANKNKILKFFRSIKVYGNAPRLTLFKVGKSTTNGNKIFFTEEGGSSYYINYSSTALDEFIRIEKEDGAVIEMLVDWDSIDDESSFGDSNQYNFLSKTCYYPATADTKVVKISAFAESNSAASALLEMGEIYYCTNPESAAYRKLRRATGGTKGNFTYSVFPILEDALYIYNGALYVYNGTELVLADNEILTGLEGRISELENNKGDEKDEITPINISYIGETHADIISNIDNGEVGLCYRFTTANPQAIIRKDNNGEVTIEKGADNLLKYRYIIDGQEYVFVNVRDNGWYLNLVEVREERRLKSISQHKIELLDELPSCEAWNTEDVDGINRVMFDVYDKFDELIKANPGVITKYDPMASADIEENGVTTKSWTTLRNYMASHGFSDYPIYAKGITEGTYTIGDYTKEILTTPAYKTYIYKISEPDYKRLDYGGALCEKRVLYVQAGCHAPEYAGPIGAYNFAKILLSNGNGAKSLLSQFDVYILPVIDGYASIHRKYYGALGVNVNRNYPTAFWRPLGADYGLAAGDQFPTRIVCGIIDIIKPDVAIDMHDYTERADSLGIANSPYTRTALLLDAARVETCNMLTGVERLRSDYFGEKGRNPRFSIAESVGDDSTARSYFFHKRIKCSALLELPSTINFTPTEDGRYTIGTRMETLFSADTNSVAATLVTNFAYLMCQYNLNEF